MIYPSAVIRIYLGVSQLCWQISGRSGVIPMLHGRENHYILLTFIEGLLLMHVGVWVGSKTRDGLLQMLSAEFEFQYQDWVEEKEVPEESFKQKIIDDKDFIYVRSDRTQKL